MFSQIKIIVLALILTVVLWLVASVFATNVIEINNVPIEIKNMDKSLDAALDSYEVDLKLISDQDILFKDLSVVLDIASREKGTYTLKPQIKTPIGTQVLQVNPGEVLVRVEDKASKPVDIETCL